MTLFTIGHSNHDLTTFIERLQQHGVTALVDVRSHPYSRYLPHFTKAALQRSLQERGIAYVFLGQELGARPTNASCYDQTGKALYERIAATEKFQAGIQRVLAGAETYQIALMCAEQDPLTCHRAILVCPYLRDAGLEIHHILKDGSLESHDQLEERLLQRHNLLPPEMQQLSLFGDGSGNDDSLQPGSLPPLSRADLLKEAYQLQGDRIAYVEKQGDTDEPGSEPVTASDH
jgi:uncharacterized protein (DUF488 family)